MHIIWIFCSAKYPEILQPIMTLVTKTFRICKNFPVSIADALTGFLWLWGRKKKSQQKVLVRITKRVRDGCPEVDWVGAFLTEASAAFAAVTACDRLLVTWWVFGSDIHIYMVCLGVKSTWTPFLIQTQSANWPFQETRCEGSLSSAILARRCLCCFDHFVDLALLFYLSDYCHQHHQQLVIAHNPCHWW